MLQTIKKLFSSQKKVNKVRKNSGKELRQDSWAEKQIKEMAKLRGKLILM